MEQDEGTSRGDEADLVFMLLTFLLSNLVSCLSELELLDGEVVQLLLVCNLLLVLFEFLLSLLQLDVQGVGAHLLRFLVSVCVSVCVSV